MNKYQKMKIVGYILFLFGWFCPLPLMAEGYLQLFWIIATLVPLFMIGFVSVFVFFLSFIVINLTYQNWIQNLALQIMSLFVIVPVGIGLGLLIKTWYYLIKGRNYYKKNLR